MGCCFINRDKVLGRKQLINMEGMSCMHCAGHVTEELKKVEGVSDVWVNLEKRM